MTKEQLNSWRLWADMRPRDIAATCSNLISESRITAILGGSAITSAESAILDRHIKVSSRLASL